MRFGSVVRAVRLRRGLRQRDVADRVGVSQSVVSRLERGHLETLSLRVIEQICSALEIRVDLVPRWRGGDLDRLLSFRHSLLHEASARWFRRRHSDWILLPEVSFSVYGERGVIDIVAWHPASSTCLIIELKSELVDVNELVGNVDRKRRLATTIAHGQGWRPARVGVWVILASRRTNRRHVAAHATFLRNAFPADGRSIRTWLNRPDGTISAISLESFGVQATARPKRRRRTAPSPAGASPAGASPAGATQTGHSAAGRRRASAAAA